MSITSLQLPSNLTSDLANVQIVNIIDQLPVNPRHTWAQLAGVRSPEELTTQGLHHDAISKASVAKYDDLQLATIIANNHIRLKSNDPDGDGGFPYHVFIRNGIVYLCNDLTVRTYGIAGNNGYTVHICVSGDYKNYDVMTDADRRALYVAILAVKKALPECVILKGHGELNPSQCPGYNMDRVRRDIISIENQIEYNQSGAAKKANAFAIANQLLYMANMGQGKNADGSPADAGQVEWALNMLMELKPFMLERGLL